MYQHATAEELLEAVFSVVRAVTVAVQQCGKHASAATVELQQQKICVSYVVRAEELSVEEFQSLVQWWDVCQTVRT
jgi:hypothetical protein